MSQVRLMPLFPTVLLGFAWLSPLHGQAPPAPRKPAAANPRPETARPDWIWQAGDAPRTEPSFFRQEFQWKGKLATARLFAVASGPIRVYLDGREVLAHDESLQPVYREVTAAVQRQPARRTHVIAVEARQPAAAGPAGVLIRLDLDTGWRDAWSIVSDESWLAAAEVKADWRGPNKGQTNWKPARVVAALGAAPWPQITDAGLLAAAPLKQPAATPADQLKVARGYHVELLYSVPKGRQGSWVSMCVDPRGRLIVSDQYGGLYRVTVPPVGAESPVKVEPIPVDIGEAHGLLWAFDSLYAVVNRGEKYDGGLYRVRDTDGDDQLDTIELLRGLDARGEHGPHSLVLAPDQESLYLVCGNATELVDFDSSRVPRVWDEDLLLPRTYGRGFMKGKRAPGGYIARIDPDGRQWELAATGFRNPFDAAFNADGQLFTFDADMEWDVNTPWYRPTRICHVVSGAEFGWRNGSGKWPPRYPDSVAPVVNIGPGSPTGICFGAGARFPARMQRALFICDWSYGQLSAVHFEPDGATYTATFDEFIGGTPLPLTDVVINPRDGAMYFTIGGRRVQSGLYRVTYVGDESTEPAGGRDVRGRKARAAREQLEAWHAGDHPAALETIWSQLGDPDRSIRFAARIALEHQPVDRWQERALAERDPERSLTALLALVRQTPRRDPGSNADIDAALPNWEDPPGRDAEQPEDPRARLLVEVLGSLEQLDWPRLSARQILDMLRVYAVALIRLGPPDRATRDRLVEGFERRYPTGDQTTDDELAQLLVYLQSPRAAEKTVARLEAAPTQESQIEIAKTLRHLRAGWTLPLRERYFRWFAEAVNFRGGASLTLFVRDIFADAAAGLNADQRQSLAHLLDPQPAAARAAAAKPRPKVRNWTLRELVPLVETRLKGRDFARGRNMFAAANCFGCHRFDNQGGAVGPDLTALSGRFSPRDLLESIIEPSKVISDQYAAVTIVTLDGKVVTGRIVNLAGDGFKINTNMLDPAEQVSVDRKNIDEMFPAVTSMMPDGLLDTLDESEVLDLMAYLLSRGDPSHPAFQPSP